MTSVCCQFHHENRMVGRTNQGPRWEAGTRSERWLWDQLRPTSYPLSLHGGTQVGLTDEVPLKYTVTIRDIYTTVKKAEVSLIESH